MYLILFLVKDAITNTKQFKILGYESHIFAINLGVYFDVASFNFLGIIAL